MLNSDEDLVTFDKRIGFVGLGMMGAPMARNLLSRGYQLVVHDSVAEAMEPLMKHGAVGARSPREVANCCKTIITMLPTPAVVQEVVLGSEGLIHGVSADTLFIDMSTIDPFVTRMIATALSTRGVRMLDAPVGRTSLHAAQGKLLIMVGGDAVDMETARPIFDALGDTIVYCGPIGSGGVVKLVNNYLSVATAVLTSEALVMGVKAGIDLESILKVLTGTTATNGHLTTTFPARAFRGVFEPAFMIDLAHKDLGLALGVGAALNVPLAAGAVCREVYAQARALGLGRLDWTAIIKVFEKFADVEVRLQSPSSSTLETETGQ